MGRHIHARVVRSEKGCKIRVTHRSGCIHKGCYFQTELRFSICACHLQLTYCLNQARHCVTRPPRKKLFGQDLQKQIGQDHQKIFLAGPQKKSFGQGHQKNILFDQDLQEKFGQEPPTKIFDQDPKMPRYKDYRIFVIHLQAQVRGGSRHALWTRCQTAVSFGTGTFLGGHSGRVELGWRSAMQISTMRWSTKTMVGSWNSLHCCQKEPSVWSS